MATGTSPSAKNDAKPPVNGFASMSMGQKVKIAVIVLLSLILLWFVFNFAGIKAQARLGASYASHIACSCRYVEERPLESCYKDFEGGMEMISLTDDPKNRRISASVPLLAYAVAEKRGEFGCHQLNTKEIEKLD